MSMPVTAFIGLLTAAPLVAQERIAITSATVIDGRSRRATGESTILIEGNRITTSIYDAVGAGYAGFDASARSVVEPRG